MNQTVPAFVSGIHNFSSPETIPRDAAQDSSNFVTLNGQVVLVPGRQLLGQAGAVGGSTGLHRGNKVNGTTVLFEKRGDTIVYFDGTAWQTCISGLTPTAEYVFANYSSLAGSFVFIDGPDGYWKVVTANPASPINIFDASKNFKGYILIDRGRTILWNRDKDKTGLYGSKIDPQDATVYTTVAGEAAGALGAAHYAGTLAFKGGHAKANCFGVSFAANTGAGVETFTDDFNGNLTSDKGGTGTINYATGAFDITFNAVTTGNVTAGYQWEDSTVNGVADFTKSSPRLAGEGFVFPQDEGGDAILGVGIGQDGSYYSLKQRSSYVLSLDSDDKGATNIVYRKEMGLPFFRAFISTNKGIFFINTINPTKPEMTILQRVQNSTAVEPVELFKHFKFSNYVYDACSFGNYDRWILVYCRTADSPTNNKILFCSLADNTVDVVSYSGKMSVQDGGKLYIADSVTTSVYDALSGFDDLGNPIDAFWTGCDNTIGFNLTKAGSPRQSRYLQADDLKKVRRLRFKGTIDPNQSVGVYISLDKAGFSKVGTIWGGATYVDTTHSQAIGGNYIGEAQIGGDDVTNAYSYLMEIKIKTGKFRTITIQLIPEGIGYFEFDLITLWDILKFENRMPRASRQKQRVSLDGQQTDQ